VEEGLEIRRGEEGDDDEARWSGAGIAQVRSPFSPMEASNLTSGPLCFLFYFI